MASNITRGGVTTFDANSTQVRKRWASSLVQEIWAKMRFSAYIGTGSNAVIQRNNEFTRQAGDTYYYALSMQLDGEPRLGDAERAGHEQPLVLYDDSATIDQISSGVLLRGKMEEQKYAFNLRKEAKMKLSDFDAREMHEIIVSHLVGNVAHTVSGSSPFPAAPLTPDAAHGVSVNQTYDATDVSTSTTVTSDDDITSSDGMTVDVIRMLQYTAYMADPKVPPISVGDAEKYLLLIQPAALYALEKTSVYQQMLRESDVRGKKNALYTGAVADIHGVVIRKDEKLRRYTNNTVVVAENVLLGSQAAILAVADDSLNWHEEMVDRGNKYYIGFDWKWGIKKSRFNSKDYGTLYCSCYAPDPS